MIDSLFFHLTQLRLGKSFEMNRILLRLVFLLTFFCVSQELSASHIPGANITYTCNPSNPLEYTFTITIFRKCPGTLGSTMNSSNFSLTNDCGLTNPTIPTFNQVGVARDVNQLCDSTMSACANGSQPGVWMYTYSVTIVLPANCDGWHMAFDLCCRDASSNMTGTSSNHMACSTTLNTSTSPCNNSPVVTAAPIPYACAGTNFNYCLTTSDAEGDSISYQMVAPAGASQNPISHLAGFSPTAPLNNFTLDPLTGCMSFNHPNVGNYVVAVLIQEWDSNGNLISSIVHDFQIMVITCSNTPPTNPVAGITNFSGGGTLLGPNNIAVCMGDHVCFDLVFQDLVDNGDVLTVVTDALTLLPGATFTQTGTNPVTGTFCWTAQPGYLNDVVTFTAEDNGCPVKGTTSYPIDFDIIGGVSVTPDTVVCAGGAVQLQANGASSYTWSPATGLSCTNCPNPIASPTVSTTYTVTGNLSGNCSNTASVTVGIRNVQLTLTPPGPLAYCVGNPALSLNAQLMENGSPIATTSSPYSEDVSGTLPLCSSTSGGDHTLTFNSTVPDATGNVTLTICVVGDYGTASVEYFDVIGEGGVNLGRYSQTTAGTSHSDCNATPFCNTITITQAQWNSWNNDGQVVLTIDVSSGVNNFCNVGGGSTGTMASCVTSANVSYTQILAVDYLWSPAAGLSATNIQNPTASPTATTTYTVNATTPDGCPASNTIDINVSTPSTAPTMSAVQPSYCPNTSMTITAGGGTAGTGSTMEWYTGPNGSGTWMGTGSALTLTPVTSGQTYYVRREGACGNTADDQVTINLKDYIYALNGATTSNYCTDNAGWHHFYQGNEILLSVRGDLSGAPTGYPQITINDNGTWYQQTQGPFAPASCVNGWTPGEERFEMERNWNIDFGGGTLNPPYEVRFYYEPGERTAIENAAAAHMSNYAACGYSYKYANPNGLYWFKNTGSNYTAPDYDGLHLAATNGTTPNGINYSELGGINSFSGGTAGIIVLPLILLPAEWLYFNGETENKVNKLSWATETEQNTAYFNVQRSKDGLNFTTIGTVAAQGNSTATTYYTFDDENPFEGENYYRLELVETNGESTYSNTILLSLLDDELGYSFYPNPTQDVVNYQYEATQKEELQIEILDVLGKRLSVKEVTSSIGTNTIPVDLSEFPTGTYVVRVYNNQQSGVHTAKVIKNKS